MTFGPAKDHNYMHMLREARDQKCNNDVVIATDRKKRRMPIFPPIISQIGSYHHHAFLVRRWRHWVGWHDLGMSRIPQLDFLSAKYPAVSLVGHVAMHTDDAVPVNELGHKFIKSIHIFHWHANTTFGSFGPICLCSINLY